MHDVFLCHSEKDQDVAVDVARGLEAAGYTTWYYKRDTLPGGSYLIQVGRAVLASRCIVLIASRHSLESGQVTSEIVRAYEAQIPFIPLLLGITHRDVQARQEIWHQALIAWTSLTIEKNKIAEVLPQVIRGLENLGIRASDGTSPPEPRPPETLPPPGERRAARRWLIPAMLGVIATAVAVAMMLSWQRPAQPLRPGAEVPATIQTVEPQRETADNGVGGAAANEADNPAGNAAARETAEPIMTMPDAPRIAATPRDTSATTEQVPAVTADMVLVIDDSSGVAEEALAVALRNSGKQVVRRGDPSPTAKETERRALHGDNVAGRETARMNGAMAAVIGEARTVDVASSYGLTAVRCEISVRLVDERSGRVTGRWTASKKVALPDGARARRAAIEGAARDLAARMIGEPALKTN